MSADAVGGVWSYAMELAAGLAEQGVEVLLATLGRPPDQDQRRQAAAIAGLVLECGDYPLEWMPEALPAQQAAGQWLLMLARRFRPDIVHLNHYGHGHLPWPAPCVVVAHSCVLSWFKHVHGTCAGAAWQGYHRHVSRGLRGADMVVAPTAAMLADVLELYGPLPNVRVIHNGRQPRLFKPLRKQPHVLAAGRLWDEAKNIPALAYTAATQPWPVRVAGQTQRPDGGSADVEQALEGMQLLGVLPAEAMARAFGQASIYVLPARYEPFGLSVLEAALSGCALVLGNIPSLRELWEGAAEFAPPDDAVAIREAVVGLIEDPSLRRKRARQARERAKGLDSHTMTRSYLAAYAQVQQQQESACVS